MAAFHDRRHDGRAAPFPHDPIDRNQASWLFARAFWGMGVRHGDMATFVTNYGAHIFFWETQEGMHHLGCPVIALGGPDLKRRIDFQRNPAADCVGVTISTTPPMRSMVPATWPPGRHDKRMDGDDAGNGWNL